MRVGTDIVFDDTAGFELMTRELKELELVDVYGGNNTGCTGENTMCHIDGGCIDGNCGTVNTNCYNNIDCPDRDTFCF